MFVHQDVLSNQASDRFNTQPFVMKQTDLARTGGDSQHHRATGQELQGAFIGLADERVMHSRVAPSTSRLESMSEHPELFGMFSPPRPSGSFPNLNQV